MLGRTRCLLNHDGLDAVFSSPLNRSLSTLLSTYLLFVPVQAIFILELHPAKISNRKSSLSRVEFMVIDLLERLKGVYARIAEVRPDSRWGQDSCSLRRTAAWPIRLLERPSYGH